MLLDFLSENKSKSFQRKPIHSKCQHRCIDVFIDLGLHTLIQSNLNGSNIFGSMEIRSRHG